jgi:hypothetical protein
VTLEEEEILKKIEPKDLDSGCPHEPCMEGTREDILDKISAWTVNFDAPNILWLRGYPGIGKSTVVSTLASRLRASNRLGSSFFFQRAKAAITTTHALWQRIAVDLARCYPSVRRILIDKLETNRDDFITQDIKKLFRMLIEDSLKDEDAIQAERLPVIVIDALDECGGLEGIASRDRDGLMQTLRLWSGVPKKFKLIVASRHESDIEATFQEIHHHLIEIPPLGKAVSSDIRHFFQVRLGLLATQHRRVLPSGWPGPWVLDELTRRAQGLFIWAQTVVKFISSGIPQSRLSQILEGKETGDLSGLYSLILRISFPDPDNEIISLFHSVVGTIIVARTPLSASCMGRLLSIDETMVEYICTRLQSVLDSRGLLRFNHQSFVDFMLNNTRNRSRFLINPDHANRELTLSCLRIMKKELRFNICKLESSHIRNKDIPDLTARVQVFISQHLSYSCYYWMDHLEKTKRDNEILNALKIFIDRLFFYWLEVLSISRGVNQAAKMLGTLISWMKVRFSALYYYI